MPPHLCLSNCPPKSPHLAAAATSLGLTNYPCAAVAAAASLGLTIYPCAAATTVAAAASLSLEYVLHHPAVPAQCRSRAVQGVHLPAPQLPAHGSQVVLCLRAGGGGRGAGHRV